MVQTAVSLVNMYSAHSVLTVFNLYLVAMYGMVHTQFETILLVLTVTQQYWSLSLTSAILSSPMCLFEVSHSSYCLCKLAGLGISSGISIKLFKLKQHLGRQYSIHLTSGLFNI